VEGVENAMRMTLTRLAGPLAVAATLSGCALVTRHASIAELKQNPGRYHDKTVAIEGVVTSSYGTSFVPVNVYKVSDGTGEVTVIAQNSREVPTKGARVRVKGKVGEVATFGGQAFGLHIRQSDLDFKGR
jgi:DNA/RNA endonuclease YhcR with UshA esterase domain